MVEIKNQIPTVASPRRTTMTSGIWKPSYLSNLYESFNMNSSSSLEMIQMVAMKIRKVQCTQHPNKGQK